MQTQAIERRQVLRLIGAGALLGGVTGNAAANEGQGQGQGPGRYIVGATSNAFWWSFSPNVPVAHR